MDLQVLRVLVATGVPVSYQSTYTKIASISQETYLHIFRCVLGQHPRLRWSRRRRSAIMEKYKRNYMRNYRLIYNKYEKRFVPNYFRDIFINDIPKSKLFRRKRGLKGSGSSSRAVGLGHKSSSNQLNLRRGNKKVNTEDDVFEIKKTKHKSRVPCEPLSSEPFVNIEIIKHGRDPNVTFSSGSVVKMACGKGYGLNLPVNKTAKCVRGKWRPAKPTCLICK